MEPRTVLHTQNSIAKKFDGISDTNPKMGSLLDTVRFISPGNLVVVHAPLLSESDIRSTFNTDTFVMNANPKPNWIFIL
jgi:predicted SnoaL-like aldol condensation-catalyzing enzyme